MPILRSRSNLLVASTLVTCLIAPFNFAIAGRILRARVLLLDLDEVHHLQSPFCECMSEQVQDGWLVVGPQADGLVSQPLDVFDKHIHHEVV